ncbi:adaptin N-terminal domain-containing protein [Dictyostelium discoideum AX4]|uniref:Coatomer subunit gamma n=1 Tax=Dictyostelium discoideum TaxID=44689 RepID=COPG_DICDI|nr:adaptin N-terminal domain-containing protein [Dictyostelium discoideum AX4]Q54HL0.1 RecName: Full=Coatomer subunit gamma; AltName: Full=Gamma-coat protein; Short=Gamma-COP [Dictyostelium discoideum]EAL62772.1 adaptin N-terminal domain-containing protein [Dictyostelium discoideum AX4]|eukprot:XP_636291.1 adaptin N-terminal domain-containing protein [Dictyostelium discoideum AX4]
MASRVQKKDDDESDFLFENLDKGQVIQEKRAFNESPIHPRKCSLVISQFLYLLSRGDSFTKTEATDIFFAATKLFQSKDIPLRRLMYLLLKELSTISQDAIIVISSLTKDMSHKIELYRANAIRILCKITDSSILPQIERYFKQSIVEKDPHVSSAALVSSIHLLKVCPEIVKRWANEVQEAISNKSNMVQYHALALLHRIKQHDRLAVSKLVSNLIKNSLRSPYAQSYLIRCCVEVIEETNTEDRIFREYIESCLRSKNEMVAYEAARSICTFKNVSNKEINSAVGVLQNFLNSTKPTLRFAAVRTLNKLAQTNPTAVIPCNLDMENLITDTNRSIATLAITTLLKVGNESNVERLIKQIANFLGDINDEFKIVVVDAITSLSQKFPKKYKHLIIFLNKILRDEGTLQLKQATLDAILTVVNNIPESKEIALTELCDYIEDCDFPDLSVQILHLIGQEGPLTSSPAQYMRYIYNRVLLDGGIIRAAAVTSIAKFGLLYEPMKEKVVILLQRCLLDEDDEVRDRATLYLKLFKENDVRYLNKVLMDDVPVPLNNLQKSLELYLHQGDFSEPFDIASVSTVVETYQSPLLGDGKSPFSTGASKKGDSVTGTPKSNNASNNNNNNEESSGPESFATKLSQIPQFSTFGKLLKSSEYIELTETETEYVVNCVKHIYREHIVFQFNCTNTLNEQQLSNVSVKMVPSDPKLLKYECSIPIDVLPYGEPQQCYVAIRYIPANGYPLCSFSNALKFKVKEVDPSTGELDEPGYDDQYSLERLEIVPKDFLNRAFVGNFSEEWKKMSEDTQLVQTFSLVGVKSIDEAVKQIIKTLGMAPAEKSEVVTPKSAKHILYLTGKSLNNQLIYVRARMKLDQSQTNTDVELTIKSDDESLNDFVISAFIEK